MKIDLESNQMSDEEAEAILEAIYQMYFGSPADDVGRYYFIPNLRDKGFKGLANVLDKVLNSSEMKECAHSEVTNIWEEYLGRKPTNEEYEKYEEQIRFFRQEAKEEIIAQINRAETLRQQAAPFLEWVDLEKAQQLLDEAVANDIGHWLVWHDHGLVRYRQEKHDSYKAAVPSYKKAIAFNLDDNFPWSCEDLRHCYVRLGEKDYQWYEQGLSYFQSVIKRFPNRWTAWHQCGNVLLRMRKSDEAIDEAIECFLKEIELQTDPSWGWSYLSLLDCYKAQRRQDVAYDYFMSLVSDDPKNWGFWHSLGWLQWKYKGDPGAAIKSYSHSTQLHPEGGWFWTWSDMGWCYGDSNISGPEKYHKAFQAFETAKNKKPEDWHGWHGMGWAMEQLGGWSKAIEYFQEAICLNPEYAWSWVGLGRCYRMKSSPQYVNSWEAYQQVLFLKLLDTEEYSAARNGLQLIEIKSLVELQKLLVDSFNLDEIRELCFYLGINHEELEGSTIRLRIISLIEYCQRLNRLKDLVQTIREQRSGLIPLTAPNC